MYPLYNRQEDNERKISSTERVLGKARTFAENKVHVAEGIRRKHRRTARYDFKMGVRRCRADVRIPNADL